MQKSRSYTETEITCIMKQDAQLPEHVKNRIEDTLNQIETEKIIPAGRRKIKRRFSLAMIAAAVLICSSITVAAAILFHWNSHVVEKFVINPNQQEKLVDKGAAPTVQESGGKISVTESGVTISLEQALIDNQTAYFLLKAEAPEGEVITSETYFETFNLTLDGEEFPGSYSAGLADDDEADNLFYWEIWINSSSMEQELQGRTLGFHLKNLGDITREGSFTPKIKGEWKLDWVVSYTDCTITYETDTEVDELSMKVNQISLSPISIVVVYDWARQTEKQTAKNEDTGKTYESEMPATPPYPSGFLMKDGSIQNMDSIGPGSSGYTDETGTQYRLILGLGQVVDVEQVQAVLFGEGKIPVSIQ